MFTLDPFESDGTSATGRQFRSQLELSYTTLKQVEKKSVTKVVCCYIRYLLVCGSVFCECRACCVLDKGYEFQTEKTN